MGFPLKHFQPNMEVTEERKNCINLCHRSSNKRERERVIKHLCFIAGPGGGENESRETFVGFQLGLNLTHTKGGEGVLVLFFSSALYSTSWSLDGFISFSDCGSQNAGKDDASKLKCSRSEKKVIACVVTNCLSNQIQLGGEKNG